MATVVPYSLDFPFVKSLLTENLRNNVNIVLIKPLGLYSYQDLVAYRLFSLTAFVKASFGYDFTDGARFKHQT